VVAHALDVGEPQQLALARGELAQRLRQIVPALDVGLLVCGVAGLGELVGRGPAPPVAVPEQVGGDPEKVVLRWFCR
jgi:hypothetical protein